ncbi:MAG: hypothetical protein SFV22_17680 [Saprospiraceae bacterium]|nr:hypothetical protein [Saprospiraceae bacterium]
MSWKKTLPFFIWQSIRFARDWRHFKQIWAYHKRWKQSFQPGRNSIADELPWINFLALDVLEKHLHPEHKIFEFGGGGSTLFFCKTAGEVITVEDHAEWFNTLTETVQKKGYRHWKGFFVSPEPVNDSTPRSHFRPQDYKSSVKGLEHLSFEKYARVIDQYPEKYFDLILIDGRARPSCIQQAIPRLKTGGLLVVDNTERPHYLAAFQETIRLQFTVQEDRMAPVAYTPDFTRTTILCKTSRD